MSVGLEQRRIVKETMALIQHHRLGPGDRLPSERDLAERLAVGRNAIREALSVLETVRIVERRASSGFFLRDTTGETSLEALVLLADFGVPLTEQQVRDAVEMRRILELQAVVLACERRTDEDLNRLREVLEQSEAALQAGISLADFDARFHLSIVAATQNDVFTRVVNSFYLMSRARREVYFESAAQGRRSHTHHLRILTAVENQDGVQSVQLYNMHLQGVETFWLTTLAGIIT